jgi:hypothetical protein
MEDYQMQKVPEKIALPVKNVIKSKTDEVINDLL